MKNIFFARRTVIILAAAFAVLIAADTVTACSCMSPSLETAVDESANIVVLKLRAAEKYSEGEQGYGVDGIKQSRLSVEKVFKGKLKIGQELFFSQGGGADCIWTFSELRIGTEYLFFLEKKPDKNNLWSGYICSRSNSLKGAAADLKYLENLSDARGKTRLSGMIARQDKPAVEGETGSYNVLAGATVVIRGRGKNIKLKTDADGVYEIYNLPAGKYTVTPEKINGYKFNDEREDSAEVEITAESMTEKDFEFTVDNSISGRFLDSYGKPLKGVNLDLLPARGNKPPYFYQGDSTDENGLFEFNEIPIGTYVIVVNEKNEISARQPFGTFYYPNKTDRAVAAEITIGAGDHFKDLVITAPMTAETVTISGVLLFEDGNPVNNESVNFFNKIENLSEIKKYASPDSRTTTDKNGRFSIKILKGQKGILFGSMSSYLGKYEKCPALDKLIIEQGNTLADVETPVLQIFADNYLNEVELKFPFPECRKAK